MRGIGLNTGPTAAATRTAALLVVGAVILLAPQQAAGASIFSLPLPYSRRPRKLGKFQPVPLV